MDAQRWAVIESVYHEALAKEPRERQVYLAAACATYPGLRTEIESLLAHADEYLTMSAEHPEIAKFWEQVVGTAFVPICTRSSDALPVSIGKYRILRQLGEGGMGVVYEAEQEQPRRTVALKIIKPGLAGGLQLRRFQQESQVLGRLQHPGIAQIYEAGTADAGFGPQPYFAMELIRGESLLRYAESHRLNTPQRLELMSKIGDAVQHAHQHGVIHRDLKPANILVDQSGQPKVLDFGVARATDSDAQATRQTDVGQIVGTLAYMSPEQILADPLELDTRSDVYALGIILYELLAGRLPYTISANLHEAVRTIHEEGPAPLSSIRRAYKGDIETIAAKALEKDKARRYPSAADLAADIRRHLNDEPIIARPASATYQLCKFARRHKALVVGVAAVFIVLSAGIVASSWESRRALRAEQIALRQRDRATTAEQLATQQRDRALNAEQFATTQRHRALAAEIQAERDRDIAEERRREAERQHRVSLSREIAANAITEVVEHKLDSALLYAVKAFHTDDNYETRNSIITALEANPGLVTFLGEGGPGEIKTKDIAFHPDGRTLASVQGDGRVVFWDIGTGRPVGPYLPSGSVAGIEFTRDGERIALLGTQFEFSPVADVGIWSVSGRKRLTNVSGHRPKGALAFAPDGDTLATGDCMLQARHDCVESQVKFWSTRTGARLRTSATGHQGWITAIAFHPNGKIIASAGTDGIVRLWKCESGEEIGVPLRHPREVIAVAFSPDGKLFASGSADGTIRLWNSANGLPEGNPRVVHTGSEPHFPPTGLAHVIAFSPNSLLLASEGQDHTVRFWNTSTGLPMGDVIYGHRNAITAVAFDSTGRKLASCSRETIMITNLTAESLTKTQPSANEISAGNLERDIDRRTLRAMETAEQGNRTQAPFSPFAIRVEHLERGASGLRFSRDARFAASVVSVHEVRIWDMQQGAVSNIVVPGNLPLCESTLHPQGKIVAVGCWGLPIPSPPTRGKIASAADEPSNSTVHLLGIGGKKQQLLRTIHHSKGFLQVVFNPDGKILATRVEGGSVLLWDVATGGQLGQLGEAGENTAIDPLLAMAFSPDGRLLATSSFDSPKGVFSSVSVWDVVSRRLLLGPLSGHQTSVSSIAFSPDGRVFASADFSGMILLWRVADGKRIGSPIQIPSGIGRDDIAFTADGRTLVVCGEYTLMLWDITSASSEVHALHYANGRLDALTLSPDGKTAVTGDFAGRAITWDISPASWAALACRKTNANLTLEEWNSLGVADEYTKVCPDLAVPPSVVNQMLTRASDAAREHQIGARDEYKQVRDLTLEIQDVSLSNEVCALGSLDGFAATVLPVCERAVVLAPQEGAGYQSRGMARALMGDRKGALDDVQSFLRLEGGSCDGDYIATRKKWAAELSAARDPFKAATWTDLRRGFLGYRKLDGPDCLALAKMGWLRPEDISKRQKQGRDWDYTARLLQQANAAWEKSSSLAPEYAESLDFLALIIREQTYQKVQARNNVNSAADLDAWRKQVAPLTKRALEILETSPEAEPDEMALALEIQADVLGRDREGAPLFQRAAEIRAKLVHNFSQSTANALQPSSNSVLHLERIGDDVKPPRWYEVTEPECSDYAQLARCAGTVLLAIVVDADGSIKNIELKRGLGYGLDELAAEEVYASWRCGPATKDGRPVAVATEVKVNFRLSD